MRNPKKKYNRLLASIKSLFSLKLSPRTVSLLFTCLSLHLTYNLSMAIAYNAGLIEEILLIRHSDAFCEGQILAFLLTVGSTALMELEVRRQKKR